MVKSAYTTFADVQAYLGKTIDSGLTATINQYIRAITRHIDDISNRKLVADDYESDEEFELRYYDITNPVYLTLDDFVEIESVEEKNGDTFEDVTSEATVYPTLPPHRKLIRNFPGGMQTVRVRAKWGFMETVPEDLNWAASVMVVGMYNSRTLNTGVNSKPISKEKIGNYEVWFETGSTGFQDFQTAKDILAGYRHLLI